MPLREFRPLQLVEAHNANRANMTSLAFFGPRHQKLREWYCAGHFALAYEEAKAPCAVVFEEPDPGNHIDFFLRTPTGLHEFQLVEVQQPGRRRGDEYRSSAGVLHPNEDERLLAAQDGPYWIANAIDRKREAYGGPLSSLNLLVYVNFWAHGLQYNAIVHAMPQRTNDFGSIWLLSGDAMCCVKASAALGDLPGWYKTPAVTSEA
jgi:hypothetical protein